MKPLARPLVFLSSFFLISSSFLVGCTQKNSSSTAELILPGSSIIDSNPDASVKTTEKQISEIQKNLNQDQSYALNQDDVDFLKTAGLLTTVSSETEINSWVK